MIQHRTLVNDRAICPEIQERVPETETVRTTRLATNTLGEGYVEAIADETLLKIRKQQCQATHGKICGQGACPGERGPRSYRPLRLKDQHASLLAFAAAAYLNEMGITNTLQKTEVTTICDPPVTTSIPNSDPTKITEPNSLPDPTDNNLEDIDHFASFMRSLKAPARDETAATTPQVKHGGEVFAKIGCASCHVETIVTGKAQPVPVAPDCIWMLSRTGPFILTSHFLLHNIGTGDGIAIALVEHFGRERLEKRLGEDKTTAAEVKEPSGTAEDECSESYQTAVAEGEKNPNLLRDTQCAQQDQDCPSLGTTAALPPDARWRLGPAGRSNPPPQGRICGRNRAFSEPELLGPKSAFDFSAIAVRVTPALQDGGQKSASGKKEPPASARQLFGSRSTDVRAKV